jgi:hypothetical protein
MTIGSQENYINVADKLRVGLASISVDRGRLMVATHKYKETMTCRLAEGRPDSVLYAEDSG